MKSRFKIYISIILIIAIVFSFTGCGGAKTIIESTTEAETTIPEVKLADKEIVLMDNHPNFLDDAQIANTIWEKQIEEKVVFVERKYDIEPNNHIIHLKVYEDDNEIEYIGAITFCFERFDKKVTLDDATNIISEYVSKNFIDKYYDEYESLCEVDDETGNTFYLKWYNLKEEFEDAEGLNRFPDTFDIRIWSDKDGSITQADITSMTGYGSFDGYVQWDYDIWE